MSRFRIHKSFEEELANKADEFSLKPSARAWDGIDSALTRQKRVSNLTKAGLLLGTASVITAVIVLFSFNRDAEPIVNRAMKAPASVQQGVFQPPIAIESDIAKSPVHANNSHHVNKGPVANGGQPDVDDLPTFVPGENGLAAEQPAAGITQPAIVLSQQTATAAFIEPLQTKFVYPAWPSAKKVAVRKGIGRMKDGWNLGLSFAYLHSYRELDPKTEFAQPVTNYRNKTDRSLPGFSVKLLARYYLIERVSVAFGIGYSRMGENIAIDPPKETKFYNAIAKDCGYAEGESLYSIGSAYRYNNYYHQLELPMMLYISRGFGPKLSLSTGVGVSLAYTFGKHFMVYDYRIDHYAGNPDFLRKWNANLNAQMLLEYRANSRLLISGGPDFRYSALSTYRDNYSIAQKQYGIGASIGAQWKLFTY